MLACLSEFMPWYSFAEVNSAAAHRIEPPSTQKNEAISAARLLREALFLKLDDLDTQIDACRQRIDAIEGRFGLSQEELDIALAQASLTISVSEAEIWHAELELLDSLKNDRNRILAMVR
ncbi:MAG TPA: hypothetical protein PKM25_17190 [Candidatus Ozemobacteraceae bacterium]|nr:hypothetical protein [Candidatus Ozemobacteraceae bacterium]